MKKRILAFFLTMLFVLGSTATIFATTASAADLPSDMVVAIGSKTVETTATNVTLPITLTGVTETFPLDLSVTDPDDPSYLDPEDPNYDEFSQYDGMYYKAAAGLSFYFLFDTSALQIANAQAAAKASAISASFSSSYQTTPKAAANRNGWFAVIASGDGYVDPYTEGVNDGIMANVKFNFVNGFYGSTTVRVLTSADRTSIPNKSAIINRFCDNAHFAFTTVDGVVTRPAPASDNLKLSFAGDAGSVDVAYGTTTDTTSIAKDYMAAAGDTVTLTANGEGFKYWQNAKSNQIISTNNVYTYEATKTVREFIAVYEEIQAPGSESYSVCFKDGKTGKIVKTMNAALNAQITEADFPVVSCIGHTLTGWKVGRADAIGYNVVGDVVVTCFWAKDAEAPKNTLTISKNGENVVVNKAFGEIVLVDASDVVGFTAWQINSTIVSTDPVFRFAMPSNACTLTAVASGSAPAAVAANIGLTNEGQIFYYTMSRSVAAGNTILETGVLMTRKATAADLVVDTTVNTVSRGISTARDIFGVVGFQKDATAKAGTWLVRGYVTYKDASNVVSTVYTDVTSIAIA